MRRTFAVTLCVMILALSVCMFTSVCISDVIGEARHLHNEAVRCVESGDPGSAGEFMVRLAVLWREKEPLLQAIASHDAIHEVKIGIIEAQICLECGDHDDFLRCISIAGEALEHMEAAETLSLSNLY